MTKKFEYTDVDGKIKEAETYIASEFVSVATPNSPVKTLGTGKIDNSFIPATGKSATLVVDRIATGSILRGELVRPTTPGHVGVADPALSIDEASVLGIALGDALDTETVEVLILGVISDPIFSVFAVNSILFLDDSGGVTDIKPTKPLKNYLTIVGRALGSNEIFINVSQPVTLG